MTIKIVFFYDIINKRDNMKNSLTNLEYNELNNYLNDIFTCLENETPEVINNLRLINNYSLELKNKLKKYNFKHEPKENNLTFIDIFNLSREIISSINKDYLGEFDELIGSGKLNFIYHDNTEYECNQSDKSEYKFSKENNLKEINVVRKFNYSDIKVLIHEFIHYMGHNLEKNSHNYYFLTEFLAIYFEMYTDDYLINIGVDKEELDYTYRFITIFKKLNAIIHETSILIAYDSLGKIDENTCNNLDFLHIPTEISEERFNHDCLILLDKFRKINNEHKNNSEECLYYLITSLTNKLNYALGVMLTFYARKNNSNEEMIKLNNYLQEFDENMNDLLMRFNININSENFINDVLLSVDEYINKYSIKKR